MKKHIGMWLDLRDACLVTYITQPDSLTIEEGDGPRIKHVKSDIEKRVRASGGSRTGKTPWGPEDIVDEKKLGRRRDHEKTTYFKEIIKHLKTADHVYIFGPGKAKKDLVKEIGHHDRRLAGKVVLETADKMTENQIVAKTRAHYGF